MKRLPSEEAPAKDRKDWRSPKIESLGKLREIARFTQKRVSGNDLDPDGHRSFRA